MSTENISVEYILSIIPMCFMHDKAKDIELTVVYNIWNEHVKSRVFTIKVDHGHVFVKHEELRPYDVKLKVNEVDYLRLVSGKIDYHSAFWYGRIRLFGNTLAHRELNTLFNLSLLDEVKYI